MILYNKQGGEEGLIRLHGAAITWLNRTGMVTMPSEKDYGKVFKVGLADVQASATYTTFTLRSYRRGVMLIQGNIEDVGWRLNTQREADIVPTT